MDIIANWMLKIHGGDADNKTKEKAMESKQYFDGIKVGDKLWSIQLGDCIVMEANHTACDGKYPIYVRNDKDVTASYTQNGFERETEAAQSLYWSKPEIIAPPRPKRKITKEGYIGIMPYSGGPIEGVAGIVRGPYESLAEAQAVLSDNQLYQFVKVTWETCE